MAPRQRTEEEALQRRIEAAQTPSHGQAGPAGAALLWIHVHLRDPTSVAPCHTCSRPDLSLTPRIAEPAAECPAKGGTGRSLPEPAAGAEGDCQGPGSGRRAEAHAAHATAPHDPAGSARTFVGEAALPGVRALNRPGALTLLPAMHRVVNAIPPGLVGPAAPLYG